MTPDEIHATYRKLAGQKRALERKLAVVTDNAPLPGLNDFGREARATYGKLKGVERALGRVIADALKNHVAIFDGSTFEERDDDPSCRYHNRRDSYQQQDSFDPSRF